MWPSQPTLITGNQGLIRKSCSDQAWLDGAVGSSNRQVAAGGLERHLTINLREAEGQVPEMVSYTRRDFAAFKSVIRLQETRGGKNHTRCNPPAGQDKYGNYLDITMDIHSD